jgi:hypothetical protein
MPRLLARARRHDRHTSPYLTTNLSRQLKHSALWAFRLGSAKCQVRIESAWLGLAPSTEKTRRVAQQQ